MKKTRKHRGVVGWLPCVGAIALILLIAVAMGSVETTNTQEQKRALEDAVLRTAMHCYALEGAYPAHLSHLEETYHLHIDRDRFIVHYESFSGNLAPDVTVIVK